MVAGLSDEVANRIERFCIHHDECWALLDFAAVLDLWDVDSAVPVYVGEDYAQPLVGRDELGAHFARLSARLEDAQLQSAAIESSRLSGSAHRCTRLARWRLRLRGDPVHRSGQNWTTWILREHGDTFRIVGQIEATTHDVDDEAIRERRAFVCAVAERPSSAQPIRDPV